jgi:NADH:ubiquinone oxidoreductase subunit 5 (subunit L)/multisubunit Na+/H+ antiporter MnhA subunit
MEGPMASSAVFYGALSVHLGPFLLLRTEGLWSHSLILRGIVLSIGVATAVYATLVGRTRTDAKTFLGYSTVAQISIMYIELALGLRDWVLFHMVAHSILRTWQFLRSSSLIHDFQENPETYDDFRTRQFSIERFFPVGLQKRLYLASLYGFYLDSVQQRWVVDPVMNQIKNLKQRMQTGAFWSLPGLLFSTLLIGGGAFYCDDLSRLAISLVVINVVVGFPILFYLEYRILSQNPQGSSSGFYGLSQATPIASKLFLLAGLAIVGAPGGIGFITQDIIFHGLLKTSHAAVLGFILLASLNGMIFFRYYVRLFFGLPVSSNHGAVRDISKGEAVVLGVFIALLFAIGLFPQAYIYWAT